MEAAVTAVGRSSEMAERCRAFDWASTPLGPAERWPQSLRTAADIVLAAGFPMILLWGPELVQLYNDAYIPLLGVKHPQGLGVSTRVCWSEVWDVMAPVYARVFAGETVTLHDHRYQVLRRGPGTPPEEVYVTLSGTPVRDETGAVGGALFTVFETTAQVTARRLEAERERFTAALATERARLAEVFRTAPSFFAVFRGPDHVYELVNEAYYGVVGRRELVGRSVFDVFPESREQGFAPILDGVLHEGTTFVGREMRIEVHPEGGGPPEERFVDLTYVPLTEPDGTRSGVVAHGSDVTALVRARGETARAHAELEARIAERTAELAHANETLTAASRERTQAERDRNELRRHLASAEEDERRRLSRELHDQLGQHLTAFALGLSEVLGTMPPDAPARARLVKLQDLATRVTRDIRHLALELRPPELDDVGLESAVESYVAQWVERYGIAADVQVTGLHEGPFPDLVAITLYRVLQEALTNVAKHAGARQVSVIIERPDGEVRLIVEDDGRGFEVEETLRDAAAGRRLGLVGMRERVALAGGTLSVEATPGGGTAVYARMPVTHPATPRRRRATSDAAATTAGAHRAGG